MALTAGEVILWAAVFGLLVGIVWSLKYLVILERQIKRMETRILRAIGTKKRR